MQAISEGAVGAPRNLQVVDHKGVTDSTVWCVPSPRALLPTGPCRLQWDPPESGHFNRYEIEITNPNKLLVQLAPVPIKCTVARECSVLPPSPSSSSPGLSESLAGGEWFTDCLQIDHLQALKAYEFRVRAFLEEELKQEAGRSPGAQACSRLAEGPWSPKLMVNHSPCKQHLRRL